MSVSAEVEARFVEKLSKEDKEARHRRAVAKVAEPLLKGMPQTGTHHFPPKEFRALAQYLFESEPTKLARALRSDRFKLLTLEFVCDRTHADLTMMTLSEFARLHRVPRVTLLDRADREALKSKAVGNRKLFYVTDLTRLLSDT